MPPGDLVAWVTVIAIVWLAASVVLTALLIIVAEEHDHGSIDAAPITGGSVEEPEEPPVGAR